MNSVIQLKKKGGERCIDHENTFDYHVFFIVFENIFYTHRQKETG